MYQGCTSPFQNWTVQNADCRLTADHCISGLENSQWDYFCLVLIAWWKQWFVEVCSLHLHLTLLKNLGQIPGYVGCLVGQMPHQLCFQKRQKPPPTNDFSKIFPTKTICSNYVNILLNRTQISNQVSESCLTNFLTKWLIDWLPNCLTNWLTDWFTDLFKNWSTDWVTVWPTGWLVDWLSCWLTNWPT